MFQLVVRKGIFWKHQFLSFVCVFLFVPVLGTRIIFWLSERNQSLRNPDNIIVYINARIIVPHVCLLFVISNQYFLLFDKIFVSILTYSKMPYERPFTINNL